MRRCCKHKIIGCGTGNEIEQFVQTTAFWDITGVYPSTQKL